jgi:hypothetical protein
MSDYSIPMLTCNNSWARAHYFLNKETGQYVPATCGTWSCLPCARHNVRRVYGLIHAGKPERFITLSKAGLNKESLTRHYGALVKRIRRQGIEYEAVAVNEIHVAGDLHLHIAQRGDYIPHKWLKSNWLEIIKDDYPNFKTVNARIDRLDPAASPSQALYSYMTKYMVKTWEVDSQKGWSKVQALHPGIRHYRYTRGWPLVPAPPRETGQWELHLEPVLRPIDGDYAPLSKFDKEQELIRAVRRKVYVKGESAGTPASGPQVGPLTETAPEYWL